MNRMIRQNSEVFYSFFKGNTWRIVAVITILVLSLAIRFYWATQKEGMHNDEVASFSISECDGGFYSPDVQIPTNMDITGKELKSLFFFHDTRVKGVLHDLRYMWYNVYDYNHTNFYYSLLRIFFVGSDTTDVSAIMLRGILLNMLFYVLEYVLFLRLLLVYWRDKPLLVFTGLICFAFMAGGVSNTLFIRPYELQTLMVLLLALWLTHVVRSMNRGAWRYDVKNFVITSFALAGVLWTGYFMVILVCILGAFLLWETYRHDKLKVGLPFFIGTAVCALLICYCLYQSYFLGFGGDNRIDKKFDGGTIDVLVRVTKSLGWWGWLILKNTLYPPVIVLLSAIAIYHRHEKWQIPWVILPAALFTIAVFCIVPYTVNRYMVAVTPLILLIIPTILCLLQNARRLIAATSFLACVYVAWPMFKYNIDHLYEEPMSDLLNDKQHSVYLIQDDHFWLTTIVPYLSDDVTYHMRDTLTNSNNLRSGDIVAWMNATGGLVAKKSWTGHDAVQCVVKGERPCNKKVSIKSILKGKLVIYEFYVVK